MLGRLLDDHAPSDDPLPPFVREVVDIRGVRVIRVQGPVDASIGPQVTEMMERVRTADAHAFSRPLLFDLKASTACDFATVAYLVQALQKRVQSGAAVGIVNAPAELVAGLEIAKLDGMFRVFTSEDEAIAALARAP